MTLPRGGPAGYDVAAMPLGEEDDVLDLPPLPPLGADETLGTDYPVVVLDLDPDASEQVGLDDGTGPAEVFDPVSLLDLDDDVPLAPADGSLDPGFEIDLADEIPTDDAEYGYRDGNEAPTVEEWEGDQGITTLAELGDEDGGETGLDDLATGLQGDDGLPSLPPLTGAADESEPLADDLDLGGVLDLELPAEDGEDGDSEEPDSTP